jgi:hypothetical protein
VIAFLGGKLNAVIAAGIAGVLGIGAVAAVADQSNGVPEWVPPVQFTADAGDTDGEFDVEDVNNDLDNDVNNDNDNDVDNDNGDNPEASEDNGHDTCYEATAHARSVLEALLDEKPEHEGLTNALEAIENCGLGNDDDDLDNDNENNNDNDNDNENNGHETCYEATEHARSVLEALLDEKPDHHGLTNALEAVENCGLGNEGDATAEAETDGPPEGVPQGPPDWAPLGPPAGVPQGPPAGAGH